MTTTAVKSAAVTVAVRPAREILAEFPGLRFLKSWNSNELMAAQQINTIPDLRKLLKFPHRIFICHFSAALNQGFVEEIQLSADSAILPGMDVISQYRKLSARTKGKTEVKYILIVDPGRFRHIAVLPPDGAVGISLETLHAAITVSRPTH